MHNQITYQEVAAAIAAILKRHPQFDQVFTRFEKLAWLPAPRGMIKKSPSGALLMAAERTASGKVRIVITADVTLDDM